MVFRLGSRVLPSPILLILIESTACQAVVRPLGRSRPRPAFLIFTFFTLVVLDAYSSPAVVLDMSLFLCFRSAPSGASTPIQTPPVREWPLSPRRSFPIPLFSSASQLGSELAYRKSFPLSGPGRPAYHLAAFRPLAALPSTPFLPLMPSGTTFATFSHLRFHVVESFRAVDVFPGQTTNLQPRPPSALIRPGLVLGYR